MTQSIDLEIQAVTLLHLVLNGGDPAGIHETVRDTHPDALRMALARLASLPDQGSRIKDILELTTEAFAQTHGASP